MTTTTINPYDPYAAGTPDVRDVLSAIGALFTAGVDKGIILPPVGNGGANINAPIAELPKLVAPIFAGNLSLEELVKAVGMETRQVAAKTGLETLKAKAAEREEANQKKIEEIQTQLEKLRKQKKLSPFLKAFKWIGIALGAIAAVATAAIGAITANPLLIAGAAIMVAMTINSIVNEATDGKYSIGAGVAALAKECGASEEAAQWIGMGVEIVITFVGAAFSFGAGATASAAKAAETAGKVAQIIAKVSQFAALASGINTIAQGGVGIYDAILTNGITKSKAAQKDLEAILTRIVEAQEIETKFLETIMKRAEELLASVQEIVQANTEAQTAILANQPPAVA
jgi:hypothetical protein